MKLILFVLTAVVALPVFAVNITPTIDQPICLQRVYTKQHLAANPKQKLSELTLKLEAKVYTDEDSKAYPYNSVQLVARNSIDNLLYGNTATCDFNKDGSAHCFIECDGGSFDLKQRPSWINFAVTTGYYFPFYKGVLEQNIEDTEDFVRLDGDDKDNNVFRVERVPVDQCDNAISQMVNKDGGC